MRGPALVLALGALALVVLGCDPAAGPSADGGPPGDAGRADAGRLDAGDLGEPSDQGDPGDVGDPGDLGEVDQGGGAGAQPLAGWCAALTAATRARASRCPGDPAGQPGPCFEAALARLVDQDAVAFDPAAAAACLSALTDGPCDQSPEPCGRAITGRQPPEGACALGLECASDAWCVPDPLRCPRRCTARIPAGEACTPLGPPCLADHACVGGTCAPRGGAGDPCPATPCGPGLGCGADGRCQAFAPRGTPCAAGPCAPGLSCQAGACTPPGGVDAPCATEQDCALSAGQPLTCAGGRCAPLPGPGAPCPEQQCAGARCDLQAVPPTCVAWPAPGEACLPGARCGPADRCDGDRCVPRGAPGAPCATAGDCASGRCGGGLCRAPEAPLCPVE